MGLFDMVMIKDNHISIAGGVTNAIRSVDVYLKQRNLQMEVEVLEFGTLLFLLINVDYNMNLDVHQLLGLTTNKISCLLP